MKKSFLLNFISVLLIMVVFCSCGQNGDIVLPEGANTADGNAIYTLETDSLNEIFSGSSKTEEASSEGSFSTDIDNSSNSASAKISSKTQPSSAKSSISSKTAASSSVKAAASSKPVASSGGGASYSPVYYSRPMRAMWISQWNLKPLFSTSSSTFRSRIKTMMKKIKDYGFNTVIVQLRPNGDAFYSSSYYPWSYFVTGTVDKAPNYDPTAIMVEEAHKLNLSFHAWFNPLRLAATNYMEATSSKWQTKKWYLEKKGDYVVQVSGCWYLNPAYSEVRNLIINGAKEIAQKYKVDALHIDDYFYPTTASSFDATAYKKLGGGASLASWRTNNINTLVRGIYSAVKNVNSKIKFGISPAGNINNNISELYAAVSLWGSSSGYMDYCIPQIYYGYNHSIAYVRYKNLVEEWKKIITNSSCDLVVGLGAYKLGTVDGGSTEWQTNTVILKSEVQDAKSILGGLYRGFCIFDYDSFFSTAGINTSNRNNLKSVI